MSGLEEGYSVQVVSVGKDGTYQCDEAALRRVVEDAGARGLPVAVVSVAGATRGGKSFLLNFFLRYLRAPEEARASGAWLGEDDAPLNGFNWRGGSQRNTTGILMWSKPIIMTQNIGETTKQIAVLLMDTQGTFDNTSTVKDCSTIFAMSTLISSVQIYNLSYIIKEDDLQHLLLFTRYGKLASCNNENQKPFQSLMFRVRDWMSPFEHPYGHQGGENYLKTILEAKTTKQEIKDLRKLIISSFESISCFLTPFPGKVIVDKNFGGSIHDLEPEFKQSLLEFVPLLLHPSKLIPKVINGLEIMAEELPTYFQSYLKIFNSDSIATPTSILQATTTASLETAASAAREQYRAHMERAAGGELAVPRDSMQRYHAAALDAARASFAARKTLAEPPVAAARLDVLVKDLEAMLSHYVLGNEAKILKIKSEAHAAYEKEIADVQGNRPLCLHPKDAPVLQAKASDAAMAVFTAGRLAPDVLDADRQELQQWLDRKGLELYARNHMTNAAARIYAGSVYSKAMRVANSNGAMSAEMLQREHSEAYRAALEALRQARSRSSEHGDEEDHYMREVIANIEEQYNQWNSTNMSINRSAFHSSINAYHMRLSSVWGAHGCVSPRTLEREHRAALAEALNTLHTDTATEDESELELHLKQACERRYEELQRANAANNESLVTVSYAEYCRQMDMLGARSITSVLVVPFIMKLVIKLPKYHKRARDGALQYFNTHRRDDGGDGEEYYDKYIIQLQKKLSEGFDVYCNPVYALARELGIKVPAMASDFIDKVLEIM